MLKNIWGQILEWVHITPIGL